jgi:hypothetical protein
MDDVSRRVVLAGATGAGLSVLFGVDRRAHGTKPQEVTELFVIGPYNLGDWLKQSDLKFGGRFVNLGDAAREAMIKSFRTCSVYVIDQRIRPENGAAQFAKDAPRIAFSGVLHHEWKSGAKRLVVEISGSSGLTEQKIDNEKPIPTRAFRVIVQLRTAEEDGETRTWTTTVFSSEPLTYDIKGSKG